MKSSHSSDQARPFRQSHRGIVIDPKWQPVSTNRCTWNSGVDQAAVTNKGETHFNYFLNFDITYPIGTGLN